MVVEFDTICLCASEDVFFSTGWPFFGVEFDVERLNGACNKSLNEKFVHLFFIDYTPFYCSLKYLRKNSGNFLN
jgi:hypothetical protein